MDMTWTQILYIESTRYDMIHWLLKYLGILSSNSYLLVLCFLCRFVETKRYMDFVSPGSQAREGTFFGIEASLEGLEPG